LIPDVIISVREKTDVATARRSAIGVAGFDEKDAGALGIVVTEAATNLIKHAGGGDVIVRRTGSQPGSAVEILAIDQGPGIADIARSFEDGYSTAGSPGTGLGAIARVASHCEIYTAPRKGVVLLARVGRSTAAESHSLDIGAICAPYPGETVSGDSWAIENIGDRFRLVVADGLGHGPLAAQASQAGILAVTIQGKAQPAESMEDAHLRLKATRGSALSIADIDPGAGIVTFAGVGNVTGIIVEDQNTRRQMICVNGTLGYEMRRAQQYQYPLPPDSLVILHSDGLSAHWSFDKYPGLFHRHPSLIAGVLFRDYRRTRDDATIVVARARRSAA
jgi:anti-sigma regulatory factor (Ser/Thr protein kinase)